MRVGELDRKTRIGLLCLSGRTPAGHRVYTQSDLERLQQILCLKDLGLALQEIRHCLDVDRTSLQQVLESHARALEQRKLPSHRSSRPRKQSAQRYPKVCAREG